MERQNGLAFERGGEGDALLVLIHGLGATGGVWAAMLDQVATRWPGRWLALDLPGHGGSARNTRYDIADHAAGVGALVAAIGDEGAATLLGHSLGGSVALELASGRHGFQPGEIFALGVKVDWLEEEVARFSGLAGRATRLFDEEADALAFYRRQAGLEACPLDSPLLARAVVVEDGRWRAAMDNTVMAVTPPAMTEMIAAARCPIHLACGARDAMVTVDRLLAFDPGAAGVPGAGHNAMVEAPALVWDWLRAQA